MSNKAHAVPMTLKIAVNAHQCPSELQCPLVPTKMIYLQSHGHGSAQMGTDSVSAHQIILKRKLYLFVCKIDFPMAMGTNKHC